MPDFGKFADKARKIIGQHPDKAGEAVEKAGEFADQRTGGRYTDEIKQGEQSARDYLGAGDQGGSQQGQQGPGQGNQQGE